MDEDNCYEIIEVSIYPASDVPYIGDQNYGFSDWDGVINVEVSYFGESGFVEKERMERPLFEKFSGCERNKRKAIDFLEKYLLQNEKLGF